MAFIRIRPDVGDPLAGDHAAERHQRQAGLLARPKNVDTLPGALGRTRRDAANESRLWQTHQGQRGGVMTEERSLDELGPVDYLIVEFPAGQQNFTGEGADELLRLHDAGIIRIMDILILAKDDDGSVEAMELSDVPDLGELRRLEAQLAQTLAEEDVENLAAAMDPGSVAGVLVYENVWAAPFASAMRRAGGQLIANGRIPIQALIAAVEADAALELQGV